MINTDNSPILGCLITESRYNCDVITVTEFCFQTLPDVFVFIYAVFEYLRQLASQ